MRIDPRREQRPHRGDHPQTLEHAFQNASLFRKDGDCADYADCAVIRVVVAVEYPAKAEGFAVDGFDQQGLDTADMILGTVCQGAIVAEPGNGLQQRVAFGCR